MKKALLLIVSFAGGAGVVTYLGLRTEHAPSEKAILLLDARLMRVVRKGGRELSVRNQTISRVRFLVREEEVVSIFLPSGERGGFAVSFVPMVNGRNFELSRTWSYARLWPPGEFESCGAVDDRTGELVELDRSSRYMSELTQDITLAGTAIAIAGVEVSYVPIVRCDGRFAAGELVGKRGTLTELPTGEKLHELRCAAPSLMISGAWCESPEWVRLR